MTILKEEGIIEEKVYEWGNQLGLIQNVDLPVILQKASATYASYALDFLQVLLQSIYATKPMYAYRL
jgi:hypothetical protein